MSQDDGESESSSSQESTNFVSEFSYLYKNKDKGVTISQQERRESLLQEQKEKRHSLVDSFRNISEFFENDNEDIEEPREDMDVDVHKQRKKEKSFRFMRSEWFCEIPDDLEENWLVKLAPEGFRVLIIAKNKHTVVVNDWGKVLSLKTYLPGGGIDKSNGITVLDGIFNKVTKTIFILDCLFWNTMSMLDSETSFRFYWLKNKFDESYKLTETNKPHKFCILDFFPANRSLIQEKVFEDLNVSNKKVLHEGIVFYHKELHYTFGVTPLLGWLFTYMLPEKLGIDVPPENMARMPKSYECLEKYVEKRQKRAAGKKNYKGKRLEKQKMDTS